MLPFNSVAKNWLFFFPLFEAGVAIFPLRYLFLMISFSSLTQFIAGCRTPRMLNKACSFWLLRYRSARACMWNHLSEYNEIRLQSEMHQINSASLFTISSTRETHLVDFYFLSVHDVTKCVGIIRLKHLQGDNSKCVHYCDCDGRLVIYCSGPVFLFPDTSPEWHLNDFQTKSEDILLKFLFQDYDVHKYWSSKSDQCITT